MRVITSVEDTARLGSGMKTPCLPGIGPSAGLLDRGTRQVMRGATAQQESSEVRRWKQ
jgi:hypothetical protein